MKTLGRKLDSNYGNPIDNVLVDINEVLNPYYKRLNFTPNMLTTCSLLFTVLAAYLFVIDYRVWAAFFIWLVIILTVLMVIMLEHIKW